MDKETPYKKLLNHIKNNHDEDKIPKQLHLKTDFDPGFFFGRQGQYRLSRYVGMPQGEEGNIVVIGGNGSGKSASIAKPTMITWKGPICVTDIKGELSEFYARNYEPGQDRPFYTFDPENLEGPSYDPFDFLLRDGEANLVSNIEEMASIIIPQRPDAREPFWDDAERALLTAALLHYFKLGLSFSQTLCLILNSTASSLCSELDGITDIREKMFIGSLGEVKEETLASVDRGLRNKLVPLATDPYISHALRGIREGAKCFSWHDLERSNIFIRIPPHRVEQWGSMVNLLYAQLIRYLERRPEKYSEEGSKIEPTLILMDEFARFGKLDAIVPAISTLRSKKVNLCLMLQSLAQLDMIYGTNVRRVILDNCQFQALLRVNDAESQKQLSDLIGTTKRVQKSVSEQTDEAGYVTGYSRQAGEILEPRVQPHELSTLKDVLLLTPYGFFRLNKELPSTDDANHSINKRSTAMNKDAKLLTTTERTANAANRAKAVQHQQLVAKKQAQDEQRRKDRHRNFIIGEIFCQHFPSIRVIDPDGTKDEVESRFALLDAFMAVLAADKELVAELKERALDLISQGNAWEDESASQEPDV